MSDKELPIMSVNDATVAEWDAAHAAHSAYLKAKKRASEQILQDSMEELSQKDIDKLLNDPLN